MEKFKHEKRLLDFLIEENKILYSTIQLTGFIELTPESLLEKPRFENYLLDGMQYTDGVSYSDGIFIYDNNIYIYLSKTDPLVSSFSCKIYYPINRKKDVEFFILNLKKLKKDATLSKIGFIILHGPHHSAQNSTTSFSPAFIFCCNSTLLISIFF